MTVPPWEIPADELFGEYVRQVEALEAEKAQADENEEQLDGYRRLCGGLSELVADIGAGDGFYGNDPVELLVDVENKFDDIKAENATLRDQLTEATRYASMQDVVVDELERKLNEARESIAGLEDACLDLSFSLSRLHPWLAGIY